MINKKFSKKYKIPVVYYSQLMAVAYGANAKEAGLDGNIIRATKLEEIAGK
jgi:heterodisulfide reductase subunit B